MKIVNFAFVGYGFSSFVEIFDESWNVRWSPSTATKKSEAADDTPEYLRYTGSWAAEKVSLLQEQDWALKLVDNAKHSAISAVFTPYDPKEGIVVQYEVNPVDGLECGGSYLKLFTENGQFDQAEMTDKTPYTIMFGPDVCGGNNKVHFIFRHMNPISKVWEEKHMKNNVASGLTAGVWTLYTLIVKPDQTFEILINNKSEAKGSLLEDFTPSVNPPKEVPDKDDIKPEDWVDIEMIDDESAEKPEDWDEDAPATILDEKSVKPEKWCDDCPETITDDKVQKPAEWNDEDDGDWTAPSVPNPVCAEAGCGTWIQATIRNPLYKGKWSAPKIKNPEYKGVFSPRNIPNPDYFEDSNPALFTKISAIGFELWNMKANILFDNIYIGSSLEEAQKLSSETWVLKNEIQSKQVKKDSKKPLDPTQLSSNTYIAQAQLAFHGFNVMLNDLVMDVADFVEIVKTEPMNAVKSLPHVPFVFAGVLTLPLLLLGFLFGGSKSSENDAKKGLKDKVKQDVKEKKEKKEVLEEEEVLMEDNDDEEEKPTKKRSSSKKSEK